MFYTGDLIENEELSGMAPCQLASSTLLKYDVFENREAGKFMLWPLDVQGYSQP